MEEEQEHLPPRKGGLFGWKPTLKQLVIMGMLVCGTGTVVTGKMLYNMKGRTNDGEREKFEFPWFQTDAMFVGMFGCLLVWELRRLVAGRKVVVHPEKEETLLETSTELTPEEGLPNGAGSIQGSEGTEKKKSHWMSYVYVCGPAVCDMLATGVMNIGLLWIPASVWQMLRGSMVIFSAILSVVFLKRRLRAYHWFGVAVVISALVMVGISTIYGPPPPGEEDVDTSHELVGIILVVVAQLIQASQIVIEEFLLKGINLEPLLIVGLEGFWGFSITSFIILPVIAHIHVKGIYEDTANSLYMFTHNVSITLVSVLYMFLILAYNWFGMLVTQQFTAVHRTILEAMRTMFIWVTNLFIYYVITDGFGELWSNWSFLELAGFVVLFFGTLVYNEVIHLPFFERPSSEQDYQKL
eukprot:TRINITY_DN40303_c0_g1_i1.p1 TRINITY_DN40303_c0_g1~~TRINITY_DN40303_c0_g1_i1.p1  ORF type:complete len:425 (-),score=94.90 TRINITY_DN40303_c0_g1_i1:7-1239(-)